MRLCKAIIYIFFTQSLAAGAQEKLTLNQYLEQVKSRNEAYQAADFGRQAASQYAEEAKLILSPVLFSNAQIADDAKPSFIPSFNYDKIISHTYNLGLSQNTRIGLQGKFTYSLMDTEYKGLAPAYYEAHPTIELSQSLWRNFFGRETRAQIEAGESQAKAKSFAQSFQADMLLIDAEKTYWRLALARENLKLANEAILRAQRIFNWSNRRVQLSLADKSDLFQASTLLQSRKLELKLAEDEMRSAAVSFNSARGEGLEEVKENLNSLDDSLIKSLKIPEQAHARADVLAARENSKAKKAQGILGVERNRPNLELFGSYAFNSREDSQSGAMDEAFSDERPTKIVGIRFSSPLDFSRKNKVQQGWELEAKAAELEYQRKTFEQERDWTELRRRFFETQERLQTAVELEKAQREKLNYERDRQERGRSTLLQVLTFETDLKNAEGLRLRTLAELLQIAAQMKLYGVSYESF